MGEDAKVQIVSNDLVRRLLNNSEDLGAESKREIVNNYSQKLVNSGYRSEQVRRIILNGMKGYEGKRQRTLKNGTKLHRSAEDSLGERTRKVLLGKSNWFRQGGKKTVYNNGRTGTKRQVQDSGSKNLKRWGRCDFK